VSWFLHRCLWTPSTRIACCGSKGFFSVESFRQWFPSCWDSGGCAVDWTNSRQVGRHWMNELFDSLRINLPKHLVHGMIVLSRIFLIYPPADYVLICVQFRSVFIRWNAGCFPGRSHSVKAEKRINSTRGLITVDSLPVHHMANLNLKWNQCTRPVQKNKLALFPDASNTLVATLRS